MYSVASNVGVGVVVNDSSDDEFAIDSLISSVENDVRSAGELNKVDVAPLLVTILPASIKVEASSLPNEIIEVGSVTGEDNITPGVSFVTFSASIDGLFVDKSTLLGPADESPG